ncbi:DASH family cryptochrome [Motilimonas pumila]|uniref:Cryptochrome DASH n=1 Tax=Motilimonas pumila TaxID=2303987 RepID=A0A418YFE8_9GAMM|nr:DASH family cryptochrome [Motilimonas pumila]RJG47924.1 DASH family cryptochrome [Motilimonas pumila]
MKKALYWFSNDLRLQDNRTLTTLLMQADKIAFVYVIDPRWFKPQNFHHKMVGNHRWRVICQSLLQLQYQLQQHGHQLTLVSGPAEQQIITLAREHEIDIIGHGEQVGVYEQQVWQTIIQALPQVECVSLWDSTLFASNQLNLTPDTLASFSKFRKLIEREPIAPHGPGKIHLDALPYPLTLVSEEEAQHAWTRLPNYGASQSEHSSLFQGGEMTAIAHLTQYFSSDAPQTYKQTRNALDGWQQSTKLSHFLSLGNVSARQVWQELKLYEEQYGANESTYWIGFELWWREYFQWLALQLDWRLFSFQGRAQQPPLTSYFAERFKKWCHGTTPYPLVNACMRELNSTGYMSNRGRQLVASCLVNEMGIDWRFGAAYFQQQLGDHDVAANWGNWQYIAGVGADPRGGRHFNLDKQTQMFDPEGHFIAKWQGDNTTLALDSVDAADWPRDDPQGSAKNRDCS